MATKGYFGIDLGTQGMSIIFTDEAMNVIETGEGSYEMVSGLQEGCYEQLPSDWEKATGDAARDLKSKLAKRGITAEVLAIGISGQMHGEVIDFGDQAKAAPARLWCDSRNETEGNELTHTLGVKMPKRITSARWLWTLRNARVETSCAQKLTTPGGWLAQRLTGEWNLGIGDAAGMFPIDQKTLDYDEARLAKYDSLVALNKTHAQPLGLKQLLPRVRKAGESGGTLNEHGAQLLGLPVGTQVAPAEGDQPAALAGSLIGSAGMVSMSFGTSVCANSVGDRPFQGVSPAIDHFCAADGKPINMVWLRNGTTFMNAIVEMLGATSKNRSEAFSTIVPLMLQAPSDCEGVMALPFLDDEPGLGVNRGGMGMFTGLNSTNCKPGNLAKAALLATVFNLRMGCDVLTGQGFPLTEIILSGGLTKTPQLGQIIADVFQTPVKILDSATEGSAWGAALMAKFRAEKIGGSNRDWNSFLQSHASGKPTCFTPDSTAAAIYQRSIARHRQLVELKSVATLSSSELVAQ
jgi:sugar (pentulose or hexulose) kinase